MSFKSSEGILSHVQGQGGLFFCLRNVDGFVDCSCFECAAPQGQKSSPFFLIVRQVKSLLFGEQGRAGPVTCETDP